MKRLSIAFAVLLAALSVSCSRKATLEDLASRRMAEAVGKMIEQDVGEIKNLEIRDLETIYSCDSLVIFQLTAKAEDSNGEAVEGPLRYIFLKDKFMTLATGKPVYCEGVFGTTLLDKKRIADFRVKMDEEGKRGYSYFVGITSPVND